MFSIDKYKFAFFNDVNGKQTVSARSTYAGKTVKGYAKCDPRDEFDVEKGKELAAARCNARIAEKRFKRAQKKVAEAQAMVEMAQKYLASDSVRNVLIVSAEELSKVTNYNDRASCVLFGDGAAAAVIGSSESSFSSFLGADGSGAEFLRAVSVHPVPNPFFELKGVAPRTDPAEKGQLFQDGKEVYKFAVSMMPHAVETVLEKAGLTVEDIDMIIPHQANIRIIQTAASKLGADMDKFYVNIEKYGNTSSASIPIALTEAVETGAVKRGDRLVLVGFGAGLTYGAVCMEY